MKSKKIIIAILFIVILLLQIIGTTLMQTVYAVENISERKIYYNKPNFTEKLISNSIYNRYVGNMNNSKENLIPSFTTSLIKNDEKLYPGDEFEVNVKISDLISVERGIIVVYGKLNYDKNVLNLVELIPQNEWQIAYNEKNKSFVMDNEEFINNENIGENDYILKIKFEVKDIITEETNTVIEITDIIGSNAKLDISCENARLETNIVMKEQPIFTSEKYRIEENDITRIAPNTTFAEFKSNIETNQNLILKDRAGNLLDSDSYCLATNMTLTVGENKVYTLVVIGDIADIDGNGQISITDLAQIKLYYIGLETLSETALKAADINGDNQITVTDLAQLKLVLIGLMEIQ